MQLLAVLTQLLSDHGKGSTFVRKFLYGNDQSEKISQDAQALLADDRLAGDRYALIEHDGMNSLVIGSDKLIFKLEVGELGFGLISESTIPEELAAKIIVSGKCNNVAYALCEPLDTSRRPPIDEIIAYLFKAKNADLVYLDASSANFGYDAQGNLKVLDHKHFENLTPKAFVQALTYALMLNHIPFPHTVCDGDSPAVIRAKEEIISFASSKNKNYLAPDLKTAPPISSRKDTANILLLQITGMLDVIGGKATELKATLPEALTLASMSRDTFLAFYDVFRQQLEQSSSGTKAQLKSIDDILNGYFKNRYPPKERIV